MSGSAGFAAQDRLDEGFGRVRGALAEGQAHVEGLLALLRERAAAEDAYSKALLRLSRQTLALDERVTEPAIFEALASLRGDLMNESVQHSELSASVQRDVLDPLSRLREGGESVARLTSTQARQAQADVKAAVERCRRTYAKYVQMQAKAAAACAAAGLPPPPLLPPPAESGGGSSSAGSSAASLVASGSSSSGGSAVAAGTAVISATAAAGNPLSSEPSSPARAVTAPAAHGAVSGEGKGVASVASPDATLSPEPVVVNGTLTARAGGEGGGEGGFDLVLEGGGESGSSSVPGSPLVSLKAVSRAPAGAASSDIFSGLALSSGRPGGGAGVAHDDDAGSTDGADSIGGYEASPNAASAGAAPPHGGAPAKGPGSVSGSTAPGAGAAPKTRRGSQGGGSEAGSYSSFDVNGDNSFAGRIRSMASGIIGTISVPPTTAAATANANMTAAERIELARSLAVAATQLSDEAWAECLFAWSLLARAREACLRQLSNSSVILGDFERKRVAELSDSLRRYAVFISSMHANLQFDVQRLSAKLEAISDSQATTLTALSAVRSTDATVATVGPSISSAASAAALAAAAAGNAAGITFGDARGATSVANALPASSTSTPIFGNHQDGGALRRMSDMSLSFDASALASAMGLGAAASVHTASVEVSGSGGAPAIQGAAQPAGGAGPAAQGGAQLAGGRPEALSPQALSRLGRSVIAALPTMPSMADMSHAWEAGVAPTSAAAGAPPPAAAPHALSSSAGASMKSAASAASRFFGGSGPSAAGTASARAGSKPMSSSPLAPKGGLGIALDGLGSATHAVFGAFASAALPGHPPRPAGGAKGISVSVGAVGAQRKLDSGARAVERGPIEYFVIALFDPTEGRVRLAPDGTSVVSVTSGNSSDGASDVHDIPSLSLADFAAGKSPSSTPTGAQGRSRVGTSASGHDAFAEAGAAPLEATDFLASSGSGSGSDESGLGRLARIRAPSSGAPLAQLTGAVAVGDMNAAVVPLLPQVRRLLKSTPDGLSRFVEAVDSRRAEGAKLTRPCFDALASIMWIALDVAAQRSAFGEARTLMVISQSLYAKVGPNEDSSAVDPSVAAAVAAAATPRAPEGAAAALRAATTQSPASSPSSSGASGGRSSRVYMQVRIRAHPIWQEMSFWESAIYESIGSEMSKIGGGADHGGGALGAARGRPQSAEQKEREQDLLLGQLGFFAFQMIDFCVPTEAVKRVLDKYARFIHLDASHLVSLTASLQRFSDARAGGK